MVHYELNEKFEGIKLYFDGVFPDTKLRNEMKLNSLRWNSQKKCWYTKPWNDKGVKFIKKYCEEFSQDAETITFDK